MGDKKDRRMVENYEITNGIMVGDKEVVFGVDEKAEMPYLCGFYVRNSIFESYQECMVGDDYAEIMELFADRVKAQCTKVHEEQAKVTVPREKITAMMCTPLFQCGDIEGKVMVVKLEALRPEYRSADCQLIYVTGGHGARKDSLGTSCYGISLYSGKREQWRRYEFQGEIKQEYLPMWAKERLEELQMHDLETGKSVSNQYKNKLKGTANRDGR